MGWRQRIQLIFFFEMPSMQKTRKTLLARVVVTIRCCYFPPDSKVQTACLASSTWAQTKGEFREAAYKNLNIQSLESRFGKTSGDKNLVLEPMRKRPRIVFREPVAWCGGEDCRVEVLGDSMLVVNWLNGIWRCRYHYYNNRLRLGHHMIQQMSTEVGARPRQDAADWGRHIYRELNVEADKLANQHRHEQTVLSTAKLYKRFRLFFDGGVTANAAGGGWILY